ncbi:protein VAC14 homolog isoform X3 [Photinus pyralis]|uniref:protein VAC14 homolog isoform X3 n=1 Tax=Photinus pyralis TaxID=7054 RepID=UPI001266F209|nr:protein VAC14 homolog isoform X3 [Photinus pyralis]XP_031359422.1 protein VAC14 homolog isoform X3 [Photinus pyralis]
MMSEKDYAPLSPACVRALHDKLYDKRKTAALEIEKMVKEFASLNKTNEIKRLLKVLGQDFANSTNPHARKGGLIGLAAIAIALGRDTSLYTEELIYPIVARFSDPDSRVKYYACESLYNVAKVARGAVLPQFSQIFSALSKIATDSEQSIKNASELLDRLMKDIVTESPSFDLPAFMPLLRERIYTKSSFARQFVISWISVLDAVPDIDLIIYLPEILDGLFKILDDPMLEVKKMCDTVLGEFLRSIKSNPARVDFGSMINILIGHAQEKNDEILQFTAITWIKEFVQLSGPLMLPYMSGIFTAVLPCLAYDADSRRMTDIKETATAVNHTLMKLVSLQVEQGATAVRTAGDNEVRGQLDLPSVVEVLTQHIAHSSVQTKVAVLRWIHHLYIKLPNKMFSYIDILFPALLRTLADPADEVVQQCLVVIAEVISAPAGEVSQDLSKTQAPIREASPDVNSYYTKFLISLLNSFSADKHLLEERGSFIIRQLCVLLNAEDIYWTLAKILLKDSNLKFASLMVGTLNMILLTSSELFELRNKLKDLNTKESCTLFCCLYETWCHDPVATVALCLLTQCYKHICDLIKVLYPLRTSLHFSFFSLTVYSGNIEVTVEFLTEIDKLVQLIESPIFAYLRLELLEVPCDQHLVRALYGLLMLLPQTEAFQTLRTRLACIPSLHLECTHRREAATVPKKLPEKLKEIDFKKLLAHFNEVQARHKDHKKSTRAQKLAVLQKANVDI